MGICLFHKKFSAKCLISEIIYGNASILKFNFLKIEFQSKTRFLDNRVIANWKIKNKKNSRTWASWTRVPCKFLKPYSVVLKPYGGVLKPYSGVLKHVSFFP